MPVGETHVGELGIGEFAAVGGVGSRQSPGGCPVAATSGAFYGQPFSPRKPSPFLGVAGRGHGRSPPPPARRTDRKGRDTRRVRVRPQPRINRLPSPDRQHSSTSYGVVWHDHYCCKWVSSTPAAKEESPASPAVSGPRASFTGTASPSCQAATDRPPSHPGRHQRGRPGAALHRPRRGREPLRAEGIQSQPAPIQPPASKEGTFIPAADYFLLPLSNRSQPIGTSGRHPGTRLHCGDETTWCPGEPRRFSVRDPRRTGAYPFAALSRWAAVSPRRPTGTTPVAAPRP